MEESEKGFESIDNSRCVSPVSEHSTTQTHDRYMHNQSFAPVIEIDASMFKEKKKSSSNVVGSL